MVKHSSFALLLGLHPFVLAWGWAMGQLWICPQRPVTDHAADASSKAQPQPSDTERTYCGMLWQFYSEQVPPALANVLEWYEFVSYAYVEDWIAVAIFQKSNAAAWLTFGVAFVSRPFGGLVIGWCADRFGRRAALLTSTYLMFGATVGQGLTPAVGYVGPACMLLCRCLQGLSAGGQSGSLTVLLIESAPKPILAQTAALNDFTAQTGAAAAIALSVVLNRMLSAQQMLQWGWRVPFLLTMVPGALIIYAAHWTRESQEFEAARAHSDDGDDGGGGICCVPEDAKATITDHWPNGLMCFLASAAGNSAIYLCSAYLKQWFTQYCHMSGTQASGLMFAAGLVTIFVTPALAAIADTYGLAKCNIGLASTSLVVALPMYVSLYACPGSPVVLAIAGVLIPGFVVGYPALTYPWGAELFPVESRGASFSVYYNMGAAVGGLGPFICSCFGSTPLFPAYYTMVLGSVQVLVFVSTLRLNEAHKADPSRLRVAHIRPDPY